MKTVHVVAAVICDDPKRRRAVFATARGYGDQRGQWEFPGGKVEPGEAPEQALIREISEELNTQIRVGELIDTVEWDYPAFHLSMRCYWCSIESGDLTPIEAQAARWLRRDELYTVPWLPADRTLIEKVQRGMGG